MDQMVHKFFRAPLAFKLDAGAMPGAVSAVFSTFDVVDKDSDVVLASAFIDGQEVPMTWAHDWSQIVGKGVVRVDPDRAIFDGAFFTDTAAGLEAYHTVKAMGRLQEYSFGFQVLASDYEARAGQPVRVIKQARIFEVSPVLVGAGENTGTIAIKSGQPYAEQAETALAAVRALVGRSASLADVRAKEGRTLSSANREKLAGLLDTLTSIAKEIGDLLAATEPPKALPLDYLERRLRASGMSLTQLS